MNTDRFRFRVWDSDVKKMYYHKWAVESAFAYIYDSNREWPDVLVLMQCTGLKDSEGRLVWEGDILTGVSHDTANFKTDDSKKVWITVVEWKYDMWYVGHGNYEYTNPAFGAQLRNCNNAVKVIGNIYENPELLSGD